MRGSDISFRDPRRDLFVIIVIVTGTRNFAVLSGRIGRRMIVLFVGIVDVRRALRGAFAHIPFLFTFFVSFMLKHFRLLVRFQFC